jgi:hypothetical protein
MSTEYLDFELELGTGSGNGSWPLSVIQSPGGNWRGTMALPDAAETLALSAQNIDTTSARAFGKALFDALLVNSGGYGTYAESQGAADALGRNLRVKLRIVDPALAVIPWELLYDPRFGEFVALSHESPIVRYAEAAQPVIPLVVEPPLRILGMAVSPSDFDSIELEAQKQAVDQALAWLKQQGLVEMTWLTGSTWRDLQRAMRPGNGPWHMFYFVGHGAVKSATGEGVLILADEQGKGQALTASEVGRILAGHSALRLVMLNACRSAASSPSDLYVSTAGTLVRLGVPAVIAMQFPILLTTGEELARTFFEALAEGLPVEWALTEARIAVSVANKATLDWAAPVVYLRSPDGVLFQVKKQGTVTAAPAPAHAVVDTPAPAPAPALPAVPNNLVKLTGAQYRDFQNALLSAFDGNELRQMVRIELDENLDAIAGGNDLRTVVFNLIDWARRTGRLGALMGAALNANPTSPELRAFVAALGG